jgi:hypothetical protein
MVSPLPPQSDFGVDVGENPERLARNAARKAEKRGAMLAKKAEMKRVMAESRPQIDAARAEREAAANRNAAQYGGLSQADISSALNKAMYAQGASEEARLAAAQNLVSGTQEAPRDIRGNTDIASIMQLVSQYATPDQLNAALKASGRQGTFNPFNTYNTGVSGATQSLNDLLAASDARRIAIENSARRAPVTPMTPQMQPTPMTPAMSPAMTPPMTPAMSPAMLGNAPPVPVAPPPMMGPVEGPAGVADYAPYVGLIDNRIGPNFGRPMQPGVTPRLGDMFRGSLRSPMQPTAPGTYIPGLGLRNLFAPKPPTNVVDPGFNIMGDPNFRFGTSPQAPNPNAQGMAMGGLINKYYL